MRIWSIHPMYLDPKGLVALWRETLLAKHIPEDKTNRYRNHPQLQRFKNSDNPIACINHYLIIIHDEALKRGYSFNKKKLTGNLCPSKKAVTKGQLEYERDHLLKKLIKRDY